MNTPGDIHRGARQANRQKIEFGRPCKQWSGGRTTRPSSSTTPARIIRWSACRPWRRPIRISAFRQSSQSRLRRLLQAGRQGGNRNLCHDAHLLMEVGGVLPAATATNAITTMRKPCGSQLKEITMVRLHDYSFNQGDRNQQRHQPPYPSG